jgi:hypothetical protein
MGNFYKLTIFIFLFPFIVSAQTNYQPGYIINKKGDTVKGFIDVRTWNNSPKTVDFKAAALTAPVKTFKGDDIKGFSAVSLIYKSFITHVSTDRTGYGQLSVGRDTGYRIDTVFLEQVQRGKNITLYTYSDPIKTRFYVVENTANKPEELIYRLYMLPDNPILQKSQNIYMAQLYALAQKYNAATESLKQQIENSKYELYDLRDICSKINYDVIVTDAAKSGNTTFGVFIGAGFISSKITPTGVFPVFNFPGRTLTSVVPDIGINVYPNSHSKALAVRLELAYVTNNFSANVSPTFGTPATSPYTYKQGLLAITPQVQYNIYNGQQLGIYLNLGFSINRAFYSGNSFTYPSTGQTYNNFLSLNQTYYTIPFKAGVIIAKNVELFVVYNYSESFTDNTSSKALVSDGENYSLNMSSIRVGINYNFSF